MERKNQFGKTYTIEAKGVSDAGVHNYLRDFRGLFSAAMSYYNKPSLGITLITYNPFKEFRIIEPPQTRKRNIEIEQVKLIRDCKVRKGSRAEMARDLFMLSFYMCGINAVDLFKLEYVVRNGRMEYNRSKTKGKRKDKAFISIYQSKDDLKNRKLQPSVSRNLLPSVQVVTTGLNYEQLPANTKVNSIVITVHADYLKESLKSTKENRVLQMITSGDQPLLFEEIISPKIQEVAAEIIKADPAEELQDFYYK
ncbi:hypothetical protein SAMN05421821_12747 [Mucilaginibacter lappiensis]|uniref:Phage integrase SAM-like domain-containing protein n=1 Tax=Mucilaginibacter lappiensis TaxID=354630 RepID=A0ABR6PTA6_9SPHI|nr:hypothetical protein [Mucilaginibacter lappiensis]MBB6113018.1 hypothetical protein [Mucilaginibacter lappiensis]SIS11244.1 hypothetical protein SAMN05421821_12747 [Mucilaginibacter lappiensis]